MVFHPIGPVHVNILKLMEYSMETYLRKFYDAACSNHLTEKGTEVSLVLTFKGPGTNNVLPDNQNINVELIEALELITVHQ